MAAVQNLTIDQGSTFTAKVGIQADNEVPYDLTGATAQATMRKAPTSSVVAGVFNITIQNPADGTVIISMTDEQTAVLKAGRYMYDLYIEDSLGQRYRAIEGLVTVTPSITK